MEVEVSSEMTKQILLSPNENPQNPLGLKHNIKFEWPALRSCCFPPGKASSYDIVPKPRTSLKILQRTRFDHCRYRICVAGECPRTHVTRTRGHYVHYQCQYLVIHQGSIAFPKKRFYKKRNFAPACNRTRNVQTRAKSQHLFSCHDGL
jgi:hypothetical protein